MHCLWPSLSWLQDQIIPWCLTFRIESLLVAIVPIPKQLLIHLQENPLVSTSLVWKFLNFPFPPFSLKLDDILNIEKSTEHFHRRLSVRIISRFKPYFIYANFLIELCENSDQMLKTQISVNNKALNLMKFSKMSIIQSLVSKDSVNREEFSWAERLFISYLFEISWRYCCGMSS